MLEIGLGCDMGYGPGASLKLWHAFLPCAKISFVEYDRCAAALQMLRQFDGKVEGGPTCPWLHLALQCKHRSSAALPSLQMLPHAGNAL